MIHILSRTEREDERFYHAGQNGVQFKAYELFISEIAHLMFLDHGWPRVTETWEHERVE